jgi:CubicO group peptidase (beta-lactamase class C family)
MKKTIALLSILILCGLHHLSFCQSSAPSFIKDSIDSYIARGIKDWDIPGVAVCIVKDGKVVLMKGFGKKERSSTDRIDENTLFMIASNTKAFTATALAMLDAEKKLSLEDKVTKWIPEFKLDNKLAGEQAIIRDLLCHRLGFQTFQGDFTFWKSNLTRAEVIEKMSRIKAVYPFRTTWGYSNSAFLTAGEIIPKVTGISWEEYIKEKIFIPLGMTRTLALTKDMLQATNKAMPHTVADGKLMKVPFANLDNLAPAASISSSVNDLSKWMITQLNDGKYQGKQIIPAAAIWAIRTPNSIIGHEDHFSLYGLGVGISEYEGREIVYHIGAISGFLSRITLIPEEKLGVVVLTNTDQNSFYAALDKEIVDAYLKLPYGNYSKVYLDSVYTKNKLAQDTIDKMFADSVALHLKAELPLKEYTGKYTNEVYGDMQIVLEKGVLRIHLSHHPTMHVELQSLGGNRFYAIYSDLDFGKAVCSFRVENNKVKAATVKASDFLEFTPYIFLKTNQ